MPDGKSGLCGVRLNEGGKMCSSNYGKVCASTVDPIEKKPIFHYRPGTRLFSLGTFGCNMDCMNCQNFNLARSNGLDLPFNNMSPDEVVEQAVGKCAQGIGWTFNEPVVWAEFILDTAKKANRKGLFSLLNTNGFIEPGARDELLRCTQVMNIDVKGFTEEFYRNNCSAELEPVLETCTVAKAAGVHVELTYLLIPGLNDSREEVQRFCEWVVDEMGPDTPIHFFRFRPFYKLADLPPQTIEKLKEAYDIAKSAGVKFPYYAGVVGEERQNTYCPKCGELLVKRASQEVTDKVCVKKTEVSRFCPTYSEVEVRLQGNACPRCGEHIPIVLGQTMECAR
ncbi:MAG: AmmeMemoRadiSam system radical SAM enzyme [Methanomassiliicoccales archaeon]|nr:AmmeMemoRadiSam system radical SAM enzyme [Methanomassiliicoccales archaeon]